MDTTARLRPVLRAAALAFASFALAPLAAAPASQFRLAAVLAESRFSPGAFRSLGGAGAGAGAPQLPPLPAPPSNATPSWASPGLPAHRRLA